MMNLTREEIEALYNFLLREYISHEHYPKVHEILKKMRDFLNN